MRTALLFIIYGALAYAQDNASLFVVDQIKQEALESSKVIDHLPWLADANGLRLTNSPGFYKSANRAWREEGGTDAPSPSTN